MGLENYTQSQTATPEEVYREWLKTTEKSPRTVDLYDQYLREMVGFMDSTINDLVEYHSQPENKGGLKRAFMDFMKYQTVGIEKNGELMIRTPTLSRNTAEMFLKALNGVLTSNELPKIKLDKYSKSRPNAKSKIARAQVRELIATCGNARARALVLTLKDCGLRVGDVALLEAEDFINAQVKVDREGREYRIWSKKIVTQKMGVEATVILGYESVKALKLYLNGRTTGRLFLSRWKKPCGHKLISVQIRWLCRELNQQGYNVSAHSFRKLHVTNLTGIGNMPLEMVKMLCGKQVDASDSAYLKYEDELIDRYIDAYPIALALDESTSKVKELEQELRTEQKQRNKSVEDMQVQIDHLTDTLNKMLAANFKSSPDQPLHPKHVEAIKKIEEN